MLPNAITVVLWCRIIPADCRHDRTFLTVRDSFNITIIYLIIMLLLYSIKKRVISDLKLNTSTAQYSFSSLDKSQKVHVALWMMNFFHFATPFSLEKHCKPLAIILRFLWEIFRRATFLITPYLNLSHLRPTTPRIMRCVTLIPFIFF